MGSEWDAGSDRVGAESKIASHDVLQPVALPVSKRVSFILIAVAAVSGALLSARALFGPFHFLTQINSPLNLQSIFGLLATLALLCRMKRGDASVGTPIRAAWADIGSAAAVILIGLAAFWRNLWDAFLSDDYYLVTLAASTRGYSAPLFKHGGGSEFFRPVGGLALALTAWAGGTDPFFWHLASLAVHLANSMLVFLLVSRLFSSRPAALVASILFAIHGTRPEAVIWISGRFDLISTLFVLTGLLLFVAHLGVITRAPIRAAACYAGSLLAMTLAILTKESAYVFPALLMLTLAVYPGASRRGVQRTLPFWALAGVLFAVRWWALGGIGGYIDQRTGQPEALSFRMLPVVKALALRVWSALYFPVNWSIEPSRGLAVAFAASVAVIVWLLWTVSVERRRILFSVAFVVISSLPAIHQLLIGGDLQGSRLLYLPAAGFCMMLGFAVEAVQPKPAMLFAALVLLGFDWACLQHNERIWHQVASIADRSCSQVFQQITPATRRIAIRAWPGSLDGVFFLRNGLSPCLDLKAHRWLGVEVSEAGALPAGDPATLVFGWDDAEKSPWRLEIP